MTKNPLRIFRWSLLVGFFTVYFNFDVVMGAARMEQVFVCFRHGGRSPTDSETYPEDPFSELTYHPIGRGGLTNEGKRKLYALGKMLKSRYGNFFGAFYHPGLLEAWSSDIDRTKMSLQLVLAGLFPPAYVQVWDGNLPWQPIPTSYKSPFNKDTIFGPMFCPKYISEYDNVINSPEVQDEISEYSDLMAQMEKFTGLEIYSPLDLYFLYHTFDAQKAANLTLPEWVNKYYPRGKLRDATVFAYKLMSYNDNLKRMNGGTLLRTITDNMHNFINGDTENRKKLFLYSGHEINIAAILRALGVFEPRVPAYGSAVIIEMTQQRKEYYVKVLEYTGMTATTITHRIPGCSRLCPLKKFMELMQPVIATDSDMVCE